MRGGGQAWKNGWGRCWFCLLDGRWLWGGLKKGGLESAVDGGWECICRADGEGLATCRFGDAGHPREFVVVHAERDDVDFEGGVGGCDFGGRFAGVLAAVVGVVVDEDDACGGSFVERGGGLTQGFGDGAFATGVQLVERGDDAGGVGERGDGRDDFDIIAIATAPVAERHEAELGCGGQACDGGAEGITGEIDFGWTFVGIQAAPHGS